MKPNNERGVSVAEMMSDSGEQTKTENMQAWAHTKLGGWIFTYGVMRLVSELRARGHSMTDSAVYYWLRGDTVPRPDKAHELVMISGGLLTLDDIYSHQHAMLSARLPGAAAAGA